MKFRTVLASFMLGASLLSCAKQQVKIQAEIRPEINYLTHLYTLAGLGFQDEEYVSKYGNTLSKASIDTLSKYSDYLVFGQGQGGVLSSPFFFSISSESLLGSKEMSVFMENQIEVGKSFGMSAEIMKAFDSISEVYVSNYDNYLQNVYPKAKEDMLERQNKINEALETNSLVKDWEKVTGYKWTYGDYHWLLYRAGANGPSYNNLNLNTNTVYYNQDFAYQMSMFSHEFGIFLMMDSVRPIYEGLQEYTRSLESENDLTFVPWSAFESLSCWYNCKIAGEKTVDYMNFGEANVETFCKIYDNLEARGVTDPAKLYHMAVIEYIDQLGIQTN